MTWRLRFYDGDGVEIGYAEKPDEKTYNVYITHPDSGWEDFKEELESWYELEDNRRYEIQDTPGWDVDFGPRSLILSPESHLRKVQERFSHPDVSETTLKHE